jgi:hypothetical protein
MSLVDKSGSLESSKISANLKRKWETQVSKQQFPCSVVIQSLTILHIRAGSEHWNHFFEGLSVYSPQLQGSRKISPTFYLLSHSHSTFINHLDSRNTFFSPPQSRQSLYGKLNRARNLFLTVTQPLSTPWLPTYVLFSSSTLTLLHSTTHPPSPEPSHSSFSTYATMSSANSPTSTRATSTRITDSMLGMSPGEVRLLLLTHLCIDRKTGKVCTPHIYPKFRNIWLSMWLD